MPVFGVPSRAYAMTERPATVLIRALYGNGRDLDITIKGEGWMSVDSGGGQAFTSGRLFIDASGAITYQHAGCR